MQDTRASEYAARVSDRGAEEPEKAEESGEAMNLGFQDQFVPFVENGSKTHSIRAGERWKVGMRADCYARPRQKGMRLLFRAPVVRVEKIRVRAIDDLLALGVPLHKAVIVTVDGTILDGDEVDAFAWRDGFRVGESGYGAQMMAFWAKAHDLRRRDFHGQIIHWDYAARFMDIRDTCFHESARRARAGVRA